MTYRNEKRLPPLSADAMLIWPRGGNSGDMLILRACERYLRDRGIEPWLSDGSVEDAATAGDDGYLTDVFANYRGMVMFPGGGNIGIYPDNGLIRERVISHLGPRHRCLVFPQSALGPEAALARPQVTVWCRDAVSQSILVESGVRTELVPDAAFYLDGDIPKAPSGSGIFYIRRDRKGDVETIEHGMGEGLPSADLTHRLPLPDILAALEPYETVVSDRLHGGLIALMQRKKVALLPVGYHKTRSFYETWLEPLASVTYIEHPAAFPSGVAALREETFDFKALFCRHADPALQRFILNA